MIILHSALLDSGLFLWAEAQVDAESASGEGGAARGAASSAAPVPDYPFAADFDALARVIRNLPVGFRPTRTRLQAAAAWLPTQGKEPHPSSELIGEAPSGRGRLHMAPWRVEGLLLKPAEYLRVLTVYGDRVRALHGLVGGRDFSFWIQALRFAGSLVARQRYLPDLERQASQWHARWRPVWLGDDADEHERLARRMPAAARALTPEAADEAPRVPARERLETFLSAIVDEIVRSHGGLIEPAPAVDDKLGKAQRQKDGNVYDRWLRALRSGSSRVVGSAEDLESLGRQIRLWREPIDQAARAPFRLCFRLEEPAPGADDGNGQPQKRRDGRARKKGDSARPRLRRWFVRYLLQGKEDPELLVPTADAWVTRGHKAAALSRMGADLHETLLAFLGQAAGLCSRIEETLRSSKPSGYSLDARGAHEFLTVTAPALQQAGFGTTLPHWWTGSSTEQRLSVRARVHTPPLSEAGSPSLEELLDFEWE
ncbi:MAG: SNF2 helicase-associated domain-containing protein, partial [bacterium]